MCPKKCVQSPLPQIQIQFTIPFLDLPINGSWFSYFQIRDIWIWLIWLAVRPLDIFEAKDGTLDRGVPWVYGREGEKIESSEAQFFGGGFAHSYVFLPTLNPLLVES